MTTKIKKIGLTKIEIHIDWFGDIKNIAIQAKYKDYFLDIQIDKIELAIGCSEDEPDCTEFINIDDESNTSYIYSIIEKHVEKIP